MSLKIWLGLFLALQQQNVPAEDVPAFVRAGDRVEQEFRDYRESLMSAPREGSVQAAHFKLLLSNLP